MTSDKNTKTIKRVLLIGLILIAYFGLFALAPAWAVTPTGTAAGGEASGGSGTISSLFGYGFTSFFNSMIAMFFSLIAAAAGIILNITASILNVSIVMTLNIKELVTNTPAIYTVWKAIRDVTGLFFIFYLLSAAIKMMLGLGGNYRVMIKNIVLAGIAINFSFLITSVLIDASNIVSQALYNSMKPANAVTTIGPNTSIKSLVVDTTGSGTNKGRSIPGMSDIFMNSLKIQTLYDTKAMNSKEVTGDPFKIAIINIVVIIMMLTTAASFLMAAAAFIARLVILLFLLAFSPVWFAATVIDRLGEYASKFTKALFSQLIFMPAYLLLMYAALMIVNNSNLFGLAKISLSDMPAGTNWSLGYTILGVNFALVIIMLNLPLAVGLAMGGYATSIMSGVMKKYDALNAWKWIGGSVKSGASNVGSIVGTNTLGRASQFLDKKMANTIRGNWSISRDLRAATTGAVAKSKFGGQRNIEDRQKIAKDVAKKETEILNKNEFDRVIVEANAGAAGSTDKLKTIIGKMSKDQKVSLGYKVLNNKHVVKHLKDSDLEAIKKSDEFTDAEKKDILDQRKEALNDAITRGETDVVKSMIEKMDGKDLLGIDKTMGIQTNPDVVKHLKISQLKTMRDEGLDPGSKNIIKTVIDGIGPGHSAYGWINRAGNW